ncbi:MAG: hypothetical protein V2B20_03075 [Pseudomonadota bacterium]
MAKYHRSSPFLVSIALLCFSPFLASIAMAENTATGSSSGSDGAVWTWANKVGTDNMIYISRNIGGTWTTPETVSTKGGINVVPSVTSTDGENLFAVWSNYSGSQAQLRYRQLINGSWSEENEYYTGLSANMSASTAYDNSGKLWMVWSGYSGISDEIYYTTWNGSAFETAKTITSNDVPDILPVLGIDTATGNPWVQWKRYSPTGYQQYESIWNGSEWTEPVLVKAETVTAQGKVSSDKSSLVVKKIATSASNLKGITAQSETTDAETKEMEIEIPSFVTNPKSASTHIPGYAVQSLPVRSLSTVK